MAPVSKCALLLNSEIAAVITAMRQNAKWAMVPGKYNVSSALVAPHRKQLQVTRSWSLFVAQEEDQMEPEPHYEEFRALRRKIFDTTSEYVGCIPEAMQVTARFRILWSREALVYIA
jgi:hypothetical protein